MGLSSELARWKETISRYAREEGLDFSEVIFEILDWKEMNVVAAYGGFPNRYPHWRFGMEYERIAKSYEYGLSKIYEMVINNDPCYAYLLHSNSLVDQKMVMAHVYGHADFFKNNIYFTSTNRRMIDEMGNHRTRIQRYAGKHGIDAVEVLIDRCLAIDNLIDLHAPAIRRRPRAGKTEEEIRGAARIKSKDYMDRFVNPPEFLQAQEKKIEAEKQERTRFPVEPERDIMLFLIENAPLENWERDVLDMIREEAYYFIPQAQTKIMNEGWAAYNHSRIMTRKALCDSELIDYADHHSGTLSSQVSLNPYRLGSELFRDIEERWDRGCFGKEYEECDDIAVKKNWDMKLGKGREKVFEARRLYNDLTFIDTFLTPEFCARNNLFSFAYSAASGTYEIESRDFAKVKSKLLETLTNNGNPFIEVADANYRNRGELYLMHKSDGTPLRLDWAKEAMKQVQVLWKRPVHLETIIDENRWLLSAEGEEVQEKRLG